MNHFDKSNVSIVVPNSPKLLLKTVDESNLENLRLWKNENSAYFFFKDIITPYQQDIWYQAYLQRKYDLMFVATFENHAFGCLGIRWQEGSWDVYNVILGIREFGKRGFMGLSLAALIEYAATLKGDPVTLKVLKSNPAVSWYQNMGFVIIETHALYYFMRYQPPKKGWVSQ